MGNETVIGCLDGSIIRACYWWWWWTISSHRCTPFSQGDYAKAERLFELSQAEREKNLGPSDPDVAQSLNNGRGC